MGAPQVTRSAAAAVGNAVSNGIHEIAKEFRESGSRWADFATKSPGIQANFFATAARLRGDGTKLRSAGLKLCAAGTKLRAAEVRLRVTDAKLRAVPARLRAVRVKVRAAEVELWGVDVKLRVVQVKLGADEVKICAAEVVCQKPARQQGLLANRHLALPVQARVAEQR